VSSQTPQKARFLIVNGQQAARIHGDVKPAIGTAERLPEFRMIQNRYLHARERRVIPIEHTAPDHACSGGDHFASVDTSLDWIGAIIKEARGFA
jgi:hypothetical protein